MAGPGFVHLHVHSSYSLLESALTIARLAELAKADRQPALALTDTDNMFGALEFSEKMAGVGIQPIVGCALAVDFGDQEARVGRAAARLPAYRAAGRAGGRLPQPDAAQFARVPGNRAEREAARQARLARRRDGRTDRAHRRAGRPARRRDRCRPEQPRRLRASRRWRGYFGDRLYVELQRHGTASERATEDALIELAYARGVPLVATNAPLFATREDYEAHDALICIAEGRFVVESDRRQFTPEHRFKTRAEMMALFSDLPEALASTVEIAQRCAFRPRTQAPILPRFSVGEHGAVGRRGGRTAQARRGRAGAPPQGCTGSRPAAPSRTTAIGSPSSSR